MAQLLETSPTSWVGVPLGILKSIPLHLLFLAVFMLFALACAGLYLTLVIIAPVPRAAYPSEKKYITSQPSGTPTEPKPLPAWHDTWEEQHLRKIGTEHIEPAELYISVVVPAYNEEERLPVMLEEAIAYLDVEYGRPSALPLQEKTNGSTNGRSLKGDVRNRSSKSNGQNNKAGYEIILVDDGSTDKTVDVALAIAHKHELHDVLRVVSLRENRGKGGAVTHGFRHVRGQFAIFADADGASAFGDLGKLVQGCEAVNDASGRGVAVGSRAHMVGSEAVIKRSALRNALMHGFHLLLRLLTPPATSSIRDTQCGFKLFSRASLPYIIPYMHAEGWIFDVEMLMLAESAPHSTPTTKGSKSSAIGKSPGIKVAEVPIGWKEVGGSKLNVMWDSLGMAYGLATLRLCWALGVYKRR